MYKIPYLQNSSLAESYRESIRYFKLIKTVNNSPLCALIKIHLICNILNKTALKIFIRVEVMAKGTSKISVFEQSVIHFVQNSYLAVFTHKFSKFCQPDFMKCLNYCTVNEWTQYDLKL